MRDDSSLRSGWQIATRQTLPTGSGVANMSAESIVRLESNLRLLSLAAAADDRSFRDAGRFAALPDEQASTHNPERHDVIRARWHRGVASGTDISRCQYLRLSTRLVSRAENRRHVQMMRITFIEVDHLGVPVRWLGACLMPHAPQEKELVRMPHARPEPFVVIRVTYHIGPSDMLLQNRDGQSVPELTYGTCEVHVR